jgi:starch-binding outer membrane protein, SusD/RagB family
MKKNSFNTPQALNPAIRRKRKLWLIILPVGFAAIISLASMKMTDDESAFANDYLSELVKAYNTMSFFGEHGSLYTMNELTTDEMVVPVRGGDWFDGGISLRAHRHEYLPTDFYFNNAWQSLYNGIVTCNKQLFQYSKIPSPDVNAYKAELRVLRAWYYYLLMDAFGNVPLVTDYFPTSPDLPSSNTRAEIFAFIEAEINSSLADLSAAPVYGRFNQSGAKAILAKLYLNAETYIGTSKWTEAETECDDIMNSGYYNIPADYFTSFYVNNESSSEIIFQIPYDASQLQGFNIGQMTLHYASQATFNLQAQPWNGYSAVEDFYNSFEATDERKGQFLVGVQYDANSVPLVDANFDGDPDGSVINYTPAINDIANAYRQAGARIHKWKYEDGAGPSLNNDFAIFRYADIVLMKAETRLRLGDEPTALILVNQIRARAELDPLISVALSDLLAERGRELFAEAWRRQDLIRYSAYNSAWWEKNASSPNVNVFPIPLAQLAANPNLTQNPGY